MYFKNSQAEKNTVHYSREELQGEEGNIYEIINVIGERAAQINKDIKEDLNSKLEEFSYNNTGLEEVFENHEQIEISKYYESLPKPTAIAIKEFQDGKLKYSLNEEEK